MSEFLAEARILVRPDTTKFRAELEAALSVATKPITIPVVPVVAGGINAATTATTQFTSAQAGAAAETQVVAASLEKEALAATKVAAATTEAATAQGLFARNSSKLAQGAGSSALSLLGIRGATLAASGAFLAGAAAITAFSRSVQSAAALETELNVFAINAGATADQMERVSAAAKSLGRDITLPGVTASTAATAMTELAKAGLSVEDAMAGARGALELATAAQIDTGQSAKLVANTLNAFGLAGKDAVAVADLLAGAASAAQGEIGEFGTALGQVASVADQFGVSAGDTVTLLTQLAKAGLQGGRAGTTLRVAILGLIKPTAAAKVELDKLAKAGVEITKPNGAFDPTAFAQINEALKAYSKEQQNVIRNTIFSSDAIKVLGRATAGGVKDFQAINAEVNKSGNALDQSAARTKGLTGDFENLSNQVGGLSLTVGELASGPTSAFVSKVAEMVSNTNDAADAIVSLGTSVGNLSDDLRDAIPFLDKYVKLTEKLSGFGFDPVGTTTGLLGDVLDSAKKTAAGLSQAVTQNVAGLKNVPGLKEFVDNLNLFVGAVEKSGPPVKKGMKDVTNAVRDGVNDIGAIGKQAAPVFNVKQIQNIIAGFDAEEVRAKIAGGNDKLISVLQEEQTFLLAQLQKEGVKNRPALKRAIESALLGTINDIASVQAAAQSKADSLKRDAEKAARDAAQAVRDRESALLAQFGIARDQQANKIAAAAQTAGLKDDIKTQLGQRRLVLEQIAAVKQRISVEGGRKAAVVALQAILTQVNGQLKSLAQQQQQAAAQQRQALLQGIGLDIDLAEITGNQAAEVAARNRKIRELNKDLANEAKLHGKTTVEYKTIRNEIAAQNAALKQITAEKQKQGQSFAAATFEFLQTQQGFASNLLGNLIPSGATSGVVGGGSVSDALSPVAGAADARSQSGPTAGQGNATNHILTLILQQLKQINGTQAAPEANRQRAGQNAIFDYQAGF